MRDCPHPGKHTFETKAQAKRAIRKWPGIKNRDSLHAYKCGCGCFHVGHKPGSVTSGG